MCVRLCFCVWTCCRWLIKFNKYKMNAENVLRCGQSSWGKTYNHIRSSVVANTMEPKQHQPSLYHHLLPPLQPHHLSFFLCLPPHPPLSPPFLVFLTTEYPLIPNPSVNFRFVKPARSWVAFSHQHVLVQTIVPFSAFNLQASQPCSTTHTHTYYIHVKLAVCITPPIHLVSFLHSVLFVRLLSVSVYHKNRCSSSLELMLSIKKPKKKQGYLRQCSYLL